MILCSINLLLLSTLVFAQLDKITVNNEQIIRLNNPGYPEMPVGFQTSLEWHYEAKPSNAKLKVICNDIRMNQKQPWTKNCYNAYISFIEGNEETKICAKNLSGYNFETRGSMLSVKVFTNIATIYFNCSIRNIIPSTLLNIVELKLNETPKIIKLPRKPMVNLDRGWIIRSPEGSKINLECSLNVGPILKSCKYDILTVEYEEKSLKYCNTAALLITSTTNSANVRIQLGDSTNKTFECKVKAIVDIASSIDDNNNK